MEEYAQITLNEWMEWKEDIRRKLQETAENFVYIGYRLRQIERTEAYKMSGAESIYVFAQQEYGLTRTVVQRFMAISEKFGEENGVELKAEYKGLGSSKLQEMLNMSDEDCKLITEKTTVKQIRELKQFANEPEGQDEEKEERNWTPLQKCIIDFFASRKDVLNKAVELMREEITEERTKELVEIINPSGSGSHKKGIVFIFFYDYPTGVKYKVLGEGNHSVGWKGFLEVVADIYRESADAAETSRDMQAGKTDVWTAFYEAGKPEKVENLCGFEPCATSHKTTGDEQTPVGGMGENSEGKEAEENTGLDAETDPAVPEELNTFERQPGGSRTSESTTWKEPEKKERKPIELPPADAEYVVPIGKTLLNDILKGGQRFLILKKHNPYRAGNTIHLQERDNGEETGTVRDAKITHLIEDHGGITPGFCVMQIEVLPPKEEQLPGQMSIEDMENEQENTDEAGKEDGIHSESQESDT